MSVILHGLAQIEAEIKAKFATLAALVDANNVEEVSAVLGACSRTAGDLEAFTNEVATRRRQEQQDAVAIAAQRHSVDQFRNWLCGPPQTQTQA